MCICVSYTVDYISVYLLLISLKYNHNYRKVISNMKITYIKLKNFASLSNSLHSDEIEVDFTKCKNRICLLIGPNGSGKTSFLSMLQPFAEIGNLDVRNGNNLIIKDKEGYKEIHIENGLDKYIIKHFYTAHKDKNHSVKSYIEKNGNELNTNGNVTSFKEIIKEELSLETDYLKLIRLGDNVSSLISASTTERKTFMGKLMEDLDIFLNYYKSTNLKLRQLQEMINYNITKEKQLGIVDVIDYQNNIDSIKNDLKLYKNISNDLSNSIAVIDNSLSKIDDIDNLDFNYRNIIKKYNKLTHTLESKNKFESLDPNYYADEIKKLDMKISSHENRVNSNIILMNSTLSHLDNDYNQLHILQSQLEKAIDTNKELKILKDNHKATTLKLREYEDILNDFTPSLSKNELESFMVFIKNIQNILRQTYEFGADVITDVLNLIESGKDVNNYVNSHLLDIEEKVSNTGTVFLNRYANMIKTANISTVIACKEECVAKTIFNQLKALLDDSNITDKNKNSEYYYSMTSVYKNLTLVFGEILTRAQTISKLPKDIFEYFKKETMYENIKKLRIIYPDKEMNDLLSLITEYENYMNLLAKHGEEEMFLNNFGDSGTSVLSEQIEILNKSISESNDNIQKWKKENSVLNEEIGEYKKTIELFTDRYESLSEYDEVKKSYEKYKNDYDSYNTLISEKNTYSKQYAEYVGKCDKLAEQIQILDNNLSQYNSIEKDLKKMQKMYDEMLLVRDSLTSKTGIPLHFISNYLKDTEEFTNEILDLAYGGDLYIDKFDISADEFAIPYINKGKRVDDVKYASQGELSFFNIALSFALSRQALNKYNIMLLDEPDGPLDISKREKFINIMDHQLDVIGGEQSFIITHNSMFSSYSVDILDFSFELDKEKFPLANYIDIKK